MTAQEIRAFEVDLLDELDNTATDPIPNTEGIEVSVNAFFNKLEAHFGEEETGTTTR